MNKLMFPFTVLLIAVGLIGDVAHADKCRKIVEGLPPGYSVSKFAAKMKRNIRPLSKTTKTSGLTPAELSLIRENSKGVVSVSQYLNMRIPRESNSLGLSGSQYQYQALCIAKDIHQWRRAYMNIMGPESSPEDATNIFLNQLTARRPLIVFFVPDSVFKHSEANVTAEELRWFIDNPDRMGNVLFVFGAYDLVTEQMREEIRDAGIDDEKYYDLLVQALRLI